MISTAATYDGTADRSARHWPTAERLLAGLYGDRPEFDFWLRSVRTRVERAATERAPELQALDARRLSAPDWFQRPGQLGYSAYVDRFAGTLDGVADRIAYLRELGVTYLHLLPLLKARPGDSDGGFAVADYREVDPALGTMDDLRRLTARLRGEGISLCLDVVCNHVAREHAWAQAALAGDASYAAYFHLFEAERAAAYEATTPEVFPQTAPGNFTYEPALDRHVWTSFYPFQWDLNYANPAVFAEMLDVFLFLADQGVEAFRLDSTPFLWKQLGTASRNLPQTHALVQAWRALLAIAAPAVILKAEAIVGGREVLRFFGTADAPECQLAYANGAMTAAWTALATGDAAPLSRVIEQARDRPAAAAWLTYVRAHDDVIWAALEGVASAETLAQASAFYAGGAGSYASGRAFQGEAGDAPSTNGMAAALVGLDHDAAGVNRLLLLYRVALALDGLPVIYMGDEIGLGNDERYAEDPMRARDGRWLHRPRLDWMRAAERSDLRGIPGRIFASVRDAARVRASLPGFHARHVAQPLEVGASAVLGFTRGEGDAQVIVLANFSDRSTHVSPPEPDAGWTDRLTEDVLATGPVKLAPYQVRWLRRTRP